MASQQVPIPVPTLDEIIHKIGLNKHELGNECSRDYLYHISDKIDNWRTYAHVLGLKEHEISDIQWNQSLNSRHKCDTMLKLWHNRHAHRATYLELMNAFLQMENAKLAQIVCRLFLEFKLKGLCLVEDQPVGIRKNQLPIQWPRSICHEELAPTHSRQKQLRIEAALPSTPKGLLARGAPQRGNICVPQTIELPSSSQVPLNVQLSLNPQLPPYTFNFEHVDANPHSTKRALPTPEVKLPPSMTPNISRSYSASQTNINSGHTEEDDDVLDDGKAVSEILFRGPFIMHERGDKVVFHSSPMGTTTRILEPTVNKSSCEYSFSSPELAKESTDSTNLESSQRRQLDSTISHGHPPASMSVDQNHHAHQPISSSAQSSSAPSPQPTDTVLSRKHSVATQSSYHMVMSPNGDYLKVGASLKSTSTASIFSTSEGTASSSSPETSPSNITADECTSGSSLHEQYDYEYYVPNLEVNEKTEPLRCHTNTSYGQIERFSYPPEATSSKSLAKKTQDRNKSRPLPPLPFAELSSPFLCPQLKMKLLQCFKGKGPKIGVFYSEGSDKAKAKCIASAILSHLECESFAVKVVKARLKKALFGKETYSVIVGTLGSQLNKKQSISLDSKHEGKGVSEVIFVQDSSVTSPSGFLCLDSNLPPLDLSMRILCHFAAGQPSILGEDCSWREIPQLVVTRPIQKCTLGVELETKHVMLNSCSTVITCVKGFQDDCTPDLRQNLNKGAHIQSINGSCLDELPRVQVLQTIQNEVQASNTVQLMVRAPVQICAVPHPVPDLSSKQESLPIPIYFLSENFEYSNHLFGCLTSDSEVENLNGHLYDYCSPVSLTSENYIICKPLSQGLLAADYSTSLRAFKPLLSLPSLPRRNYIPQMFCENFARDFYHVFLRAAGVFLLPLSCSDLIVNPLTQCEQLLFRLRLIEQHTKCADVKKVVIVGMHDGVDYHSVQKHVDLLNSALFECDVHKQLFDQSKYRISANGIQKHSFVFMFDTSQPVESSNQLYMCIEQCIDVFAEKVKRFDSTSYKHVFEGFDGLNNDLSELSDLKGVIMSKSEREMLYKSQGKPSHALQTLQAYTTTLMDDSMPNILLRPELLIKLMIQLRPYIIEDYMHLYQLFNITTEELKQLPVVSKPFIGYILENILGVKQDSPLSEEEAETIYKWAEHLGLIFPFKSKNEIFYFVPSLATNAMGNEAKYHWDMGNELHYQNIDATVLCAFLKIPANDLFFHQLLALMIKDAMSKKIDTLYINSGCREAIIPLYYLEEELKSFPVMILYHPLQNIIEFRARIHNDASEKLLFQNAVISILTTALSKSKFHEFSFDAAVALHIPVLEQCKSLTESALWQLQELQNAKRGPQSKSISKNQLLRTKELTPQVSEEWCAVKTHKYIPIDQFTKWAQILSTGDYWSSVGAKLNLLTSDDISRLLIDPSSNSNGAEILRQWQVHSNLTVPDLLSALRAVRLDALASEIENYMLPISDV